ncbi:proteasome activator complex subunit 4-like [Daphnia carinata]|uniref:proteasome activator complex subunit 4-like n=1 Tax=Daphnia carinata TaxID=120202 RepID=UPI00257E341D|nr:proteasome activator complex subunit 4-like [Daphnia carinata]XP_059351219.1 proteasome activator complex subunit 4-like [Daphnia carinata]
MEMEVDSADSSEELRHKKLGFRPQKELIFNKFLPYAEGIDEESESFLSEIKWNLSRAVLFRELRPGVVTWTGRLIRYINLYGLKFSKEDHVKFVKLYYDLIVIPGLEASMISLFASTLSGLLKKQYLISPQELQLPWKPLYKVMKTILDSPYEDVGLYYIPASMDSVLRTVVKLCRDYFPIEATEEMLEEWRPLLCPFDMTMPMGVSLFETFLPTKTEPKNHEKSYLLWFEEFIGLWRMCHNKPSWEFDLLLLFSRLADNNIGQINWEPVMPLMFCKILNNFGLPVGYRHQRGQIGHKFDLGAVVTWIVATLGGGSSCQDHLDALFKAINSYYHPSNVGTWHTKLNDFLRRLPAAFVKRLHRERSNKKSWLTAVPENAKLTEIDITRFVESVLPVALLAMFSRAGAYEASIAFHQLAQLKPELVIPPLLERLYSALDTVTEPHRLTATLQCLVSVIRPLVRGEAYPEGPSHVLPLLMACLPAIDPNDIRKTLVTFQLVTSIATLVPFVDCSGAISQRSDLTEEEERVCSATAGFEDFVLQFIDRCFNLVESSSLEQTRLDKAKNVEKMTREESLLEVGLSSTIASLAMQCSGDIFDVALGKLYSFVGGRAFEPHVAGKFAAHIVGSVAKVNTAKVLQTFLPSLLKSLESTLASDDILVEERQEDELMFNLLLLSELMRCPGTFLLPFADQLIRVLDRALMLKAREAYLSSGTVLTNLLKSLTTIYPTDFRSVAEGYDRALSEYLPIRDWGKPGDLNNLQIKWHFPNKEERFLAEKLLKRYLETNLNKLDEHADQIKTLSREELQRTLNHTLDCILGAGAVLPPWQEEPISMAESSVRLALPLQFSHADAEHWQISFSNGKHVRLTIAQTLFKVVRHLLSTGSDDTFALFGTISICQMLLFHYGVLKEDFETHQKNFQMVKKVLGSNLIGRKADIRALMVDRIQLQHELRVLESAFTLSVVTPTMHMILKDLVQLATSQYSEVRSRAQGVLSYLQRQSPKAYQIIMEDLLNGLKPEASHEQLKGTLYILAEHSSKQRSLLVMHNWSVVKELWIAVARILPSEKPSIIQLVTAISMLLMRTIETTSVHLTFTDRCITSAQLLTEASLEEKELEQAVRSEMEGGQKNEQLYYELLDSLVEILTNGSLHWRMYNLAFHMLCLQLRGDLPAPPKMISVFVQNLIHDAIAVRKVAIKGVAAILKQQKKQHKKIVVNPSDIARQFSPPEFKESPRSGSGDQWDNGWLQYQGKRLPKTVEEWNQPRFVHKTHFGFYSWPKVMEIYAPEDQQPSLPEKTTIGLLTPGEKEIFSFFESDANIEKFVHFLSLEDRKGKDKFGAIRFSLFKGLFRNFGDLFLSRILPHLERLVCDQHEASQRCAAEIIAGLIRGSKHWSFAKTEAMWNALCPILRTAFSNVNVESISDWGTAIATASESRDPNRIGWLMELILEDRLEQGSFTDSSRLYMLQGGISQQEWRVSELLFRLLKLLRPYLNHPYQNMRDRLGSVLTNIFLHDIDLPGGTASSSPRVKDFVDEILPQLSLLLDNGNRDSPIDWNTIKGDEERNKSLRLLKTVSQWLSGMWTRSYGCQPEAQLLLLPYLFAAESSDTDKELARECSLALCFISATVMRPSTIEVALKIIKQVAHQGSWKARIASLEFLQVLTFSNLFNVTFISDGVDSVASLVTFLLADERLEVREKAAQVLGGLLHCGFVDREKSQQLLDQFQKQISHRCHRSTRAASLADVDMALIVKRHAGILGLCAFVDAFPYDVPDFLPDVLIELGNHLNDPQPIPVTIKRTLSNFRRTHHDNWQFHKQKFSDDQLVILTDLLVSPNYYA